MVRADARDGTVSVRSPEPELLEHEHMNGVVDRHGSTLASRQGHVMTLASPCGGALRDERVRSELSLTTREEWIP